MGCRLSESIGRGRSAPDKCWLLKVEGVAIMHEPEVIKFLFAIAALVIEQVPVVGSRRLLFAFYLHLHTSYC